MNRKGLIVILIGMVIFFTSITIMLGIGITKKVSDMGELEPLYVVDVPAEQETNEKVKLETGIESVVEIGMIQKDEKEIQSEKKEQNEIGETETISTEEKSISAFVLSGSIPAEEEQVIGFVPTEPIIGLKFNDMNLIEKEIPLEIHSILAKEIRTFLEQEKLETTQVTYIKDSLVKEEVTKLHFSMDNLEILEITYDKENHLKINILSAEETEVKESE
jgi:hypothetical protein